MRHFLTSILLLAASLTAHAQYQAGDMFVYPRIGFAITNLTNNNIYYNMDSKELDSKAKAGLTVGVEAERFISAPLSVSAGVMYTNQGHKYPDYGVDDKNAKTFWNCEDSKVTMHYLQVPVMFNLYVADGLALKAGVEMGYLLHSKAQSVMTDGIIDSDNNYVVKTTKRQSAKNTDIYRRFDLSIPMGASYEYMHFVLDLRYHLGLANLSKVEKNMHSSVVTFTLGYQFEL